MLHSQPLKSEAFHFPLVQGLILVVKLTVLRNTWKTSKYTPQVHLQVSLGRINLRRKPIQEALME